VGRKSLLVERLAEEVVWVNEESRTRDDDGTEQSLLSDMSAANDNVSPNERNNSSDDDDDDVVIIKVESGATPAKNDEYVVLTNGKTNFLHNITSQNNSPHT